MIAYVFPGQGAQFVCMGQSLYQTSDLAKKYFEQANDILGFRITDLMFSGTAEELKQTRVTQPAIFLHSVIAALCQPNLKPDMVAGHSLGEFSALVCNGALSFEDGLMLVSKRAEAMQKACEVAPSTMAAILGLEDDVVERICAEVNQTAVVVAANFNCPGQVVISGSVEGVQLACDAMKAAGAKRAMSLVVSGAFHSPFMEPARAELAKAIEQTTLKAPVCPVYQNVSAKPFSESSQIKANLIAQLTAPVRWTQSVRQMAADGAVKFVECGPGNVLQGLIKKIDKTLEASGL
ncbi:MAG: [acyl-carrier-protein] S-malonyltransferase [Cytophagales bacterium]|nr:MAG: [acyl-carrier-protein] S-malonyltransferase [Cytophagales bacterium]TAF61150.1 MAG: [acyl-carrier-protein] S-malonyltransferase [Cytophagales bacterium]